MPLRRRPPEPSPRLLAVLAGGERRGRAGRLGSGHWRAGGFGGVASRPRLGGVTGGRAGAVAGEGSGAEAAPGASADARARGPVLGRTAGAESADLPTVLPQPNRLGRHRRPRPPGPRILTLPRALQGARVSGPAAAALGMALVVLVAAVVLGVRVAWAKAASAPEPVGSPAVSAGGGSALARRASAPSGFGSQAMAGGDWQRPGGVPSGPQQLVVHVVGQVKRPGVVLLRPGARVRGRSGQGRGSPPGRRPRRGQPRPCGGRR